MAVEGLIYRYRLPDQATNFTVETFGLLKATKLIIGDKKNMGK